MEKINIFVVGYTSLTLWHLHYKGNSCNIEHVFINMLSHVQC